MTAPIAPAGSDLPQAEHMPIYLRAYATVGDARPNARSGAARRTELRPSRWTLIFDTETSTDAAQRLRFGIYQVRDGARLDREGVFYNPGSLTEDELRLLVKYAAARGMQIHSKAEFIEDVFFPIAYDLHATVVGFNLPFDLSRIAIDHASARGDMRGGFTFKLSPSTRRPRVQVKHLSARASLIRFTHPGEQLTPRGMRKRGGIVKAHRGFFVDVKTFAATLTSQSHSLASLGKFLGVKHQKQETLGHGSILTESYLSYAVDDVRATWGCYKELMRRFEGFNLSKTQAHTVKSEAGLGKAYLREMGILPWRQVQPDFAPEILGQIMSSYYGGRSEVRIRRKPVRVLYSDFLSMYPTVCTLMGLWKFVIAEGMDWRDSTAETRELLLNLDLTDLQKPEFWSSLSTLVSVKPCGDIFPVRAQFGAEPQATIGLNHLSADEPIWFTLADCIASKLLTGRMPDIVQAKTFLPRKPQTGLQAVDLSGNPQYRVDPVQQDFYRTVIDERQVAKQAAKDAKTAGRHQKAEQLETEQQALKTLANSTSYGIFVEVIVEELNTKEPGWCYGGSGQPFPIETTKLEKPGAYFHPLLATLITGAARLMLAIAERLALDAGINWAFCDTDSMAFAQPNGMADDTFLKATKNVRGWFNALNPYEAKGELLKLEEANRGLGSTAESPLYCYAISAKRYALFNVEDAGQPIVRKASAHGLGHLRPPYSEDEALTSNPAPAAPLREIGIERWQHDLWHQLIVAALDGRPSRPDLDFHPALRQPAISRYGATTPAILGWFKSYNRGRSYDDQIRPFGFLTALQGGPALTASCERTGSDGKHRNRRSGSVKPIAPYTRDPAEAATTAFDRETGLAVPATALKTYARSLAQYHLHPEAKFLNGNFVDQGVTRRRHIVATGFRLIGKEANRLEEQFFLGLSQDAAIDYGTEPEKLPQLRQRVADGVLQFGHHRVARATRMSLRDVGRAAKADDRLSLTLLTRVDHALARMITRA